MPGPERQGHGEAAAPVGHALDPDRAAVQLDQLLDQGEADAAALEGPAAGALDPVEALEQAGQLGGRDAGAGVADGELRRPAVGRPPDHHPDLALEGELEGVREQIEDHLLPHLAVDVDRLGQGRAVDDQAQARPIDRRAEARGELGGERREVGRLVARLDAPGLDAREVEQRVDQLEQPQAIAMRGVDQRPIVDGNAGCRLGQHLLERPQHQGQGRAELVADVREECGLGAVDLGQGLGAPALLLVGAGVGEAGRDLARDQVDEARVAGVELPVGIDARDQEARRPVLALARDRDHDRLPGRLVPGPGRQATEAGFQVALRQGRRPGAQLAGGPGGSVGAIDQRRRRRMPGPDAGRAGEPGAAVVLEQIGERERQVPEVGAEAALDRGQHLGAGVGAGELGGELAQRGEPALADHPLGLLGDDAQHARDPAVVVGQRAVGEGVVGLLGVAAAFQEQEQRLVPGRLAGVEDRLDARADVLPDLRPDVAGAGAERPGLLDPERRPVGVVAEEGELAAPRHPHGVARGQHDPDDRLQALRPARDRPERRCRPVVGGDQGAHRAAAGGEVEPWRAIG